MTYRALSRWLHNNKPTGDLSEQELQYVEIEKCIKIVKNNWQELDKRKLEIGDQIYQKIIFKEVSVSKLFLSTDVDLLSSLFMTMMGNVIKYLDDFETFGSKLKVLGELHVAKYHVKTRHFKYFRHAFMTAIQDYLPWTDEREQAWSWLWNEIITNMSDATQHNHNLDHRLSSDEVFLRVKIVCETFDIALSTYSGEFSQDFYSALIESEPQIGELFENVSQVMQGAKFLSMLTHVIKLLDDMHTFEQQISALAVQHIAYGVEVEQMEVFGKVLIETVKKFNLRFYADMYENDDSESESESDCDNMPGRGADFLGMSKVKWNATHDAAWKWLWEVIMKVFSRSMSRERAKIDNANKNNGNGNSNSNSNAIEDDESKTDINTNTNTNNDNDSSNNNNSDQNEEVTNTNTNANSTADAELEIQNENETETETEIEDAPAVEAQSNGFQH